MNIRPLLSSDIADLQTVVSETGMFPSEMLPGMLGPFLEDEAPEDLWLTCEVNGFAMGFCFARPEPLTEGTWNMTAIAVLPSFQGKGAGSALIKALERDLRTAGNRVLLADTSGTPSFAGTREFYRKAGYVQEARIRDFWAPGDDKVTFWKAL